MDASRLKEGARQIGVFLHPGQIEKLSLYEELLYEANKKTNLTRVPREECWARHFLDSMVLIPLIPPRARVLDIGSGPGLPGAVIRIVREDVRVTCLDSSHKAIAFLEKTFGEGGVLPILDRIVQNRAEVSAHDPELREAFDFVTGRAVAPFPVQIEISAAFVAAGGLFVPLRTPGDEKDIRDFPASLLGLSLIKVINMEIPPVLPRRVLPVFAKEAPTPPRYPRRWSQIRKKPLGGGSSMQGSP